jgi:rubrerythrin
MYLDRIVYVARNVQREEAESKDNQGVVGIWEKGIPDKEVISVICEDCLHEWEEEEPESCPICGGEEIAEN